MKAQLKALYELQQVDLKIAAATQALASLDSGAALSRQLAEAQKQFEAITVELRKSEAELRDNELNLKTVETKKQGFEQKLYAGQVTNPKELSSMEKEIEMLGKSRSKLDERILELYEIVERRQGDFHKSEAVVANLKQRLAETTAQFRSRSQELNSEIEVLNAQREEALDGVTDHSLLSRYETMRARYKDSGLALVQEGKCGGCHIGLTPFTVRKLKDDTGYQTCESCGRILYSE